MSTKRLTRFAIIAALYALLTNLLPALSYGPLQFRFAEIMTLLAFVDPFYLGPLTLGCAIANIWSPFGIIDVIFGTLASFLALYGMTKTDNIYLASTFPALSAVIIGLEIFIFSDVPVNYFAVTGQIMLTQFIIVSLIGVPIFKTIMKNDSLMKILKDID